MIMYKILFRSNNRLLAFLSNKYQTSTYFKPQVDYVKSRSGYLTKDQWEETRFAEIVPTPAKVNQIPDQPVQIKCNDVPFQSWNKFSEINGLDARLLEILTKTGHDCMTPIQKHTFDILNKQLLDILGSAETGSGKTIAFLAPLINNLLCNYPEDMMKDLQHRNGQTQFPLILILAPTRELVQQISSEARKLLRLTRLRAVDVIGGVSPHNQLMNLNNGCHTLIATPGRLIDFSNRGVISLKHCHKLVLDEADRMLDMGFEPQIRQIVDKYDMPDTSERHTSMFSATFPSEVIGLAESLLKKNYGSIMVGNNAGSEELHIPSCIVQKFAETTHSSIYNDCFEYLKSSDKKTLVFCNTKLEVDRFSRFAESQRIRVASLHGDFSQSRREMEFRMFRKNEVNVLVATAIAARGLDVPDIERVINMGVPQNLDEYVHRVGRCGRMGRPGEAMTFLNVGDLSSSIINDFTKMLKRLQQPIPEFLLMARPSSFKSMAPNRPRQRYDFNSFGKRTGGWKERDSQGYNMDRFMK